MVEQTDGFKTDFVRDTPTPNNLQSQTETDGFKTDFVRDDNKTDSVGHKLKREAGHVGLSVLEGFTDLGNLLGRGVYGLGDAVDYGAHAIGSKIGVSKGENWKDTPDYKKTYLHALLDKPNEWDKQLDEYTKEDGTKGERQDWANRNSYVTDVADIVPYFIPGSGIGKLTELGTQGGLLEKGLTKVSNLFYGKKNPIKEQLEKNVQELENLQPTLQKFQSEAPKTLDDVAKQKAVTDKQTNLINQSWNLHKALQQEPSGLEKFGKSLEGVTGYGLPRIALIGGVQGASAASDDDIPDMLTNTALGAATGGAIHSGLGILKYGGGKLLGLLGGKNIIHPEELTPEEIDNKDKIIKHTQQRETGADIAALLKKDVSVSPLLESSTKTPTLPELNLDKAALSRSWIDPDSEKSLSGATKNLVKFIADSTNAFDRNSIENEIKDFKNKVNHGLLSDPNHTYQTGFEVYKPVFDALRQQNDKNENSYLEPYLTSLLTNSEAYKTLKSASDILNQYEETPTRLEEALTKESPEVANRVRHAIEENEGNIANAAKSLNAVKNSLNTEGKVYSKLGWEEGTPTKDRLQEFEKETKLQNKLGGAAYNPFALTNNGLTELYEHHNALGNTVKSGISSTTKQAYEATKASNQQINPFKNEFLNNYYGTTGQDYMGDLAQLHRKRTAAEIGEKFIHKITGGLSPAENSITPDKFMKTLWNMSKNMKSFLQEVDSKKHNEFLDNIKENASKLQNHADTLQNNYLTHTSGTQNNTRSHEDLENYVYAVNAENIENMAKQMKEFDQKTDQKLYNASAYVKGLFLNKDKENPITHGLIPHLTSYAHPLLAMLGIRFPHKDAETSLETDGKKLLQKIADKAYSELPRNDYQLQIDRNLPEPREEDLNPNRVKELKQKHADIISELNHAQERMNKRVKKHIEQINEINYLKDFRPHNTLLSSLLNQQATQDLHNLQQN